MKQTRLFNKRRKNKQYLHIESDSTHTSLEFVRSTRATLSVLGIAFFLMYLRIFPSAQMFVVRSSDLKCKWHTSMDFVKFLPNDIDHLSNLSADDALKAIKIFL